ncbi:MAG: hypothetical protein M3292_07340 [Actinomycetota bacterium]|nr:hypothetical protein [Actinomycetota bacterium]
MRLALRLLAFAVLTVALWIGLSLAWSFAAVEFFEHGAISECDRGECGTLGEFTWDTWPLVPILLAVVAVGLAYLVTLRRRH